MVKTDKNTRKSAAFFQKACQFLLVLSVLSACSKSTPTQPGICLSFDDRSILEWSKLRPLFDKFNTRVTFFITQVDSLSQEEIELLRQLRNDGHEIGSHGALHVAAEDYIGKHSYEEYYTNEIDAGISSLRNHGFEPVSFAYPYGSSYWFTDRALLKKFSMVRSVSALGNTRIEDLDEIYYQFDDDHVVSALGFDHGTGVTKDMIEQAMKRAVNRNEVLMLYAHVPAMGTTDQYSFDVKLLEFILEAKEKYKLRSYRVDELTEHR
jgi:peptidoglycan/xylan/chitin deacetylase (PgdA/CDA1 family)